ncbi:LysR family transcriptional regulator [Paracoccaceae bacterium GXU_MW_L88]
MRYSLQEIETFLTVMELGTVTAASARLNVAKSVVSKRITDFETAIGAALFRRSAGRITPTEAAERLAERLRPALSNLTAATESAAWGMDGNTSLQGSLSIAAPMSFGLMYLTPVITAFADAHPALDIRVDYDDRRHDLLREGFDVGIRIGDMVDTSLMQRKLCEVRSLPVASPGYLEKHGRPKDLADLVNHEVISYTHVSHAQVWRFGNGSSSVSPKVGGRLHINNGEAIRDLAMAGMGLAMLPEFIVADAARTGALVPVLEDYETREFAISAVWPPISPMPAKLRKFVDHLVDALKDGRPWRQNG